MEIDSLSKPFLGVRFVLFGFEPIIQRQVRSKLVDGGGVDVGRYSPDCSHVIVDRICYDDPICVAARSDGKILVTSLWVDHSYDVGMPVDTTSVMYRPLKDLNGIPGAKDLVVCLTGYQRQDRDDIMTMVGLMGAQFSKPLVANKVTHLICYKFEGEKYELAKKIKKINLVNHRWLEDCLRDWELLPEINYDKSGYELEMMDAEAKDSEEEADNVTKQFGGKDMNRSPHNLKGVIVSASVSPKSAMRVPTMPSNLIVPGDPSVANDKDNLSSPVKVSRSYQASCFDKGNIPEVHGSQDAGVFKDAQLERTPNTTKVENNLAPTSKEAGMPSDSGSKYYLSYSRKTPQKSPFSMSFGKVSGNLSGSPEANIGRFKVDDVLDINMPVVEHTEATIPTGCVGTPQRGHESWDEAESSGTLPQKRMNNLSGGSFKSQKMSHNATMCNRSPSSNYRNQVLEPKSVVRHPLKSDNHLLLPNNGCYTYEAANLNSASNPHDSASTFNKKPSTPDLPSSRTVTLETAQNEDADKQAPRTSFGREKETMMASKPDIGPDAGEPWNQQLHNKVLSAKDRDSEVEKSQKSVNLDLLQGGNDKLNAKPLRKKIAAKKTLGSRHAANQKGSIYLNTSVSLNDAAVCSSGWEESTSKELFSGANELETSPLTVHVEAVKQLDTKTVSEVVNAASNNIESINDETEAPDENDEGFAKPLECEKSEVAELIHKEDIMLKTNPGVKDVANSSNVVTYEQMAAKEGVNETGLGKTGCGQKIDLDESTSKADDMKRKIIRGTKRPTSKAKAMSVPAGRAEYKKDMDEGETLNETKTRKKGIELEKSVLHHGSKISESTAYGNKLASSMEAEKENRPDVARDQTSSSSVGKSVLESMKTPTKINKNIEKLNSNSAPAGEALKGFKTQPVCFILSGHRLQRKEFQQVLRRLKGRFCRDSHQWSYQATHFIAPDPIRRTEKFFAAAASGRWILKTEYLSACSKAGKFLAEEPYEWHKNGLSEDGAISLEAPRKWRLLRERTGHGAFYGMRIIVYGECIAPPLDTLKRVVKSADGNILATSPPYNRFLKSGVDFAVVSPGMPRVDLWVQEFLKHEIPCVVADYLVEFVCKPGYSLERHVLYNTHAWAEKSFAAMLSKAEEILPELSSPDNRDKNDISCQVCGRNDRGEVMLICGDETGSVGCGVGTHIDCCDPPLENVPEDDWFCSRCSRSRIINPSKKRKKGKTLSKSK